MIKEITQDIFSTPCHAIIHQANCMHTMGSGIAAFIRENFPEAYLADLKTKKGDPAKMGTFSYAKVQNPKFPNAKLIMNLYSQFDFSRDARHTRYDSMVDGLISIRDAFRKKANGEKRTLAIPYRIGSNRGGGDWVIVRAIIESVFGNEADFDVVICKPVNPEPLVNSQAK